MIHPENRRRGEDRRETPGKCQYGGERRKGQRRRLMSDEQRSVLERLWRLEKEVSVIRQGMA